MKESLHAPQAGDSLRRRVPLLTSAAFLCGLGVFRFSLPSAKRQNLTTPSSPRQRAEDAEKAYQTHSFGAGRNGSRTILLASMRNAALFYNPLSGRQHHRRLRDIDSVLTVLRSSGIELVSAPTEGGNRTGEQVRQALAEGRDTIFACGGDGTIHDIAQGLAGSPAALGIIPLGTANALAHDLGLPLSPVAAARAALTAEPRQIAAGRIEYQAFSRQTASRLFLAAAGVGVDAHLFYKLDAFSKGRFGMASYYGKATHLWLTHKMAPFSVETVDTSGNAKAQCADVTQLLAVRIRDFGGIVRELAPGASLQREDLCLVLFRTRNRMKYLAWILRGLLRTKWEVGGVEVRSAAAVTCAYAASVAQQDQRIYVEADGELLGTLPAKISIVPDALTLLVPKTDPGTGMRAKS